MPAPYSGRCLCGGVSLNIYAEPAVVLSCFCTHCSKGAGGANQVIAKFPTNEVQVTGQENLSFYTLDDTSSGSPKEKAFCKTCGSPVWTVPGQAKGKFVIIRTAILDSGLELKPNSDLFVKNRPTWMSPSEGASQWEEMRK
ncbi:unnamed protein product [Clonostachys rosea f. rosea IK726]|uniref:Uncharacterized protein n=1 Tax=Clonostachys rosea f. rosea IK726 TaxID=1349383 RepID=A0ACA9UM35_BIOOC|nr:unnamed protein product [Clonostachys rosea f. rosea IK726]